MFDSTSKLRDPLSTLLFGVGEIDLAHEYLGVDMILIWETVQSWLTVLQNALEKMLK